MQILYPNSLSYCKRKQCLEILISKRDNIFLWSNKWNTIVGRERSITIPVEIFTPLSFHQKGNNETDNLNF